MWQLLQENPDNRAAASKVLNQFRFIFDFIDNISYALGQYNTILFRLKLCLWYGYISTHGTTEKGDGGIFI